MRESMLGKILIGLMTIPDQWLGMLVDLLGKLNGMGSGEVARELTKFLRKEPCWVKEGDAARSSSSVLAHISELTFPGVEKFVARDRFVINIGADAKVKISFLGDNFRAWMLGKTEERVAPSTLVYGKLPKSSINEVIISSLGGEANAETSLAEVFHRMSLQPNGEAGALLTNGWANIFYVKDVNGVLRTVGVGWHDDGWRVVASPLGRPSEWDDGYRVFSRKAL